MTKFIKIIIFVLALIIITGLFILIFPLLFEKPNKSIIDEFNSEKSFFSQDKNSRIDGGFNAVVRDQNYSIVQTKFDFFKPQYAFIRESKVSDFSKVWLIQLERKNIIDWKISSFTLIQTKLDLNKTREIVQKYDLSTNNPDPQNITVFPTR